MAAGDAGSAGGVGGLHEDVRAEHVGLDEVHRAVDRAVHVALRREVHDVGDALDGLGCNGRVRDVALEELVARIVGHLGDVRLARGVGHLVEVHDGGVGMPLEQAAGHVAADEAAAAGDEVARHRGQPSQRVIRAV